LLIEKQISYVSLYFETSLFTRVVYY